MVNSNVIRAVGEALKAHNVMTRTGERMPETVARALHVSPAEAELWLDALSDGCTVEEANRRAEIVTSTGNESILMTVARSLGTSVGRAAG